MYIHTHMYMYIYIHIDLISKLLFCIFGGFPVFRHMQQPTGSDAVILVWIDIFVGRCGQLRTSLHGGWQRTAPRNLPISKRWTCWVPFWCKPRGHTKITTYTNCHFYSLGMVWFRHVRRVMSHNDAQCSSRVDIYRFQDLGFSENGVP